MTPRVVEIGVCFGRLRTMHDGIGEFSTQLGTRLEARAQELEARGVRLTFCLPRKRFGIFGDRVRQVPLRDIQKQLHLSLVRYDVWHRVHQLLSHRPPLGARRRLVTVHDYNFRYGETGPRLEQHLRKARRMLEGTDLVVTDTRYVANDVREYAGFGGPVETIYLGARSLTGDPREPVAGVEPGSYLLHLSRMAPGKNVGSLLGLAEAWPEQRFLLAGPASEDVDRVRDEAATRGLGNVRVLNDVSNAQKAWLYANCAGFLLPSFSEGFGLPPLEAMHFGKPAFLSDRTCLPEIGGDVAFYFRDFEPRSMRRVVEEGLAAARQPGRAEAIAAHAARFSWDACADAYLSLYLRLAGVAP